MSNVTYLDFDLSVERTGDGYAARVLRSPCGEAEHRFAQPLSAIEVRDFGSGVTRNRQGMRSAATGDIDRVKEYGGRLFDTVFGGEVHQCLLNSLREARAQPDTGLRIRLRLNGAPELAELPWEYLYRTSRREFLALTTNTPVVRYLDLPDSARPVAVKPPLRVLAMISSPSDAHPLDVAMEWANLERALSELQQRGQVVLHRLEEATLDALRWQLREEEYHVFHYVGHAGFDPHTRRGVLMLEDDQGRAALTSAEQLGVVLHEEDSLRLVVLNACEGARSARDDIFAGTAQTLVQKDVPAVVAMQFDISDTAAITFARDFYRSLAYGDPVDTAVTQARQAIYARNELEWGTPVLYMRASEGRLFDVQAGALRSAGNTGETAPAARPAPSRMASTAERMTLSGTATRELADLLGKARVAIGAEEWDEAIDTLNLVLARFAGNDEAFSLLRRAREQKELATVYANAVRHEEAREWQQALSCLHRLRTLASGPYKDSDARFRRAQQARAQQISQQTEAARRPASPAPAPGPPAPAQAASSPVPPSIMPLVSAAPQAAQRPAPSAPAAPAAPERKSLSHRVRDGIIGVVVVFTVLAIIGSFIDDTESESGGDAAPLFDQTGGATDPGLAGRLPQLGAVEAEMASLGAVPLGAWVDQSIQQGESGAQTLTLQAGTTYVVRSVCDADCTDLDLYLTDASGNALQSDTRIDATPSVTFTPDVGGEYHLRVHMATCTVNPCAFASRLYAMQHDGAPAP